MMSVSFKITK